MRILWISFWGSWTKPLLHRIRNEEGVVLGIIVPLPGKRNSSQSTIDGVEHFQIGIPERELYSDMQFRTFENYKSVIDIFKPDIIHVHGTEKNLAQVQNFVRGIPVITSIQGIMCGYLRYDLNYLRPSEFFKFISIKNLIGRGGVYQMGKFFRNSYKYEQDILRNGRFFIGRTHWDNAHILFRNKDAMYFKGGELLRASFLNLAGKWDASSCDRHTIFMPSGFNPIKGLHWAIETVNLLKQFYPNVKLFVPGIAQHLMNYSKIRKFLIGENYINFITSKVKDLDLSQHIVFLPHLNEGEMAKLMYKANVFLSPSSIDNSPNSVGEANMIGLPVVTTPVGGVTSFLQDDISCLFAPAGDPFMMAYQIKRIFENDDLACSLSKAGYYLAQKRHNPDLTVAQYMEAYRTTIQMY